jgi:hypothetical protein
MGIEQGLDSSWTCDVRLTRHRTPPSHLDVSYDLIGQSPIVEVVHRDGITVVRQKAGSGRADAARRASDKRAARPAPGTVPGFAAEVWAEAVPLRARAAGAAAASAMKIRRELSVSDIENVSFSRIAKARGYGRGRVQSSLPPKLKSNALGLLRQAAAQSRSHFISAVFVPSEVTDTATGRVCFH